MVLRRGIEHPSLDYVMNDCIKSYVRFIWLIFPCWYEYSSPSVSSAESHTNVTFILKTDIWIKSGLNKLHEAYLKRIALKCETLLACSVFDFSAGYLLAGASKRVINFCPYITHEKRPKAWSVQKQWMINGSIFAFPSEKNPLRGFVVFTNEIVDRKSVV